MKNSFFSRHCEEAEGRRSKLLFKPRLLRALRALAMTGIFFSAIVQYSFAEDKIKIVTTTSTFASIAQEIVGDKAEIYFVASPNRDIHFISPTPKDIVKMQKADVFIHAGLDLEFWRGPLLDAVGRTEMMWPAGERQIDVSKGISFLEIPTSLSRLQGDLHVFGNPHYWLDPENGIKIAENISEGMSKLYPEEAAFFQSRLEGFQKELKEKMQSWENQMKPFKGTRMVTYHKDWPYFAKAFGLEIIGHIEPKPGIPPTAKHLEGLIQRMKKENVKLVLRDEYQEKRSSEKVAKATGAQVLLLSHETGSLGKEVRYMDWMSFNLNQILKALGEGKDHV